MLEVFLLLKVKLTTVALQKKKRYNKPLEKYLSKGILAGQKVC